MRPLAALLLVGLALTGVLGHPIHVLNRIGLQNMEYGDLTVNISATPVLLQQSGEDVTVTWSGVTNPSTNDWIAVYSPSNADFAHKLPVNYAWASHSECSDYLSTGAGCYTFTLINMRTDYAFVFMRNGIDSPVISGVSNAVAFANPNEPLQPHIAVSPNDPSLMTLTWVSGSNANPHVVFGTQSGVYTTNITATTITYTAADLCGAPANSTGWRAPGFINTAIFTGLTPSTLYYYVFGDDEGGPSQEFNFLSAPIIAPSTTFNFFMFGDMGQAYIDGTDEKNTHMPASLNSTLTMVRALSEHQLVVHIGDISYARGIESEWDNFFDQVAPVASHLPYMTCIGNHERDFPSSGSLWDGTDSGGECGVPYESRLQMPTPRKDQPWYSFNFGCVHFILMSTEHDFTSGSAQYMWILADLEAVDRKVTPWVIFSGHRPMYIDSDNETPGGGDQPVAELLREHIESLLFQYQVDLAFWGHHHSYQRMCHVYESACVPSNGGKYRAPRHFVIGSAGAEFSQNILPSPPVWAEYVNDDTFGILKIQVAPTRISGSFVRVSDDVVVDTWFIDMPSDRLQ